MLLTCMYNRRLAPSMVRETAMVIIMATVIVTFRHSPVATSDRTYFARMGWASFPGCYAFSAGWFSCDGSAVNAARLVTDDVSALDLDHTTTHLVDDVGVVRDHHDGGAGAVDPVQQPHDLDGRVRVEVSGRLVGQQDQRPVDERPGHRDALLLTAGQLMRVPVLLAPQADQLENLGHDPAGDTLGLADHLKGEGDILVGGAVGQQPEVLEHAADRAPEGGNLPRAHGRDVALVHDHPSPRRGDLV